MKTVDDLELVDMNDHEFAAALREAGWKGDFHKVGAGTMFFTPQGETLGLVMYDDGRSTVLSRRIKRRGT